MNDEMLMMVQDSIMLEELLNNIPSNLLPPEIVSDNGIVYDKATLEVSRFNLPYECIDEVTLDILSKENIGLYCSVNNHNNVVKLPHVTENWHIEEECTRWVITMYVLHQGN